MDLRQFLIAPHERSLQQRENSMLYHQQQTVINTLDPRLRPHASTTPITLLNGEQSSFPTTRSQVEIGRHNERSQLLQQQPQQDPLDTVVTREQVIRGLIAYPDILAAILRSNQISDRTPSDTGASEQHIDASSTISQATTTSSPHIDTTDTVRQTTRNAVSAPATASSSIPPTRPSLLSTTPILCFWYYHRGYCVTDPTSPTYKSSNRPCLFLHSTEGIQELRVQPGREQWHKSMGDCGLELCKFSSNYKHTEEIELNLQQKKNYRKWKSEVKRQARLASCADGTATVEGLDGKGSSGGSEREVGDRDVGLSSQSTIFDQEQNNLDAASITYNAVTPVIPTSPRAGRYAKGSRAQQLSTSTPPPIPPTLKRKVSSYSTQNTQTPTTFKKLKFSIPVIQNTTLLPSTSSTIPLLTKSAAKRLKQLAKKSIQNTNTSNTKPSPPTLHPSSTTNLLPTVIKPLDFFPYTTSSRSNPTTIPSASSLSNNPSSAKPCIAKTCFAWYHDVCPRKSKKCKDLHALTSPPSFVVTPEGYAHENGVCGRDWCSGDWRPEFGDEADDEG